MGKLYIFASNRLCAIVSLLVIFVSLNLKAQVTLVTPVPTGVVYVSDTDPGVVIFGVRNTNPSPIVITDLASYNEPGGAGTYTLWYHPTDVTGAPSAITVANGWIQLTPSGTVTPASNGVIPILSGLNLVIPSNTTYRLALEGPVHGPYYGVSGSTGDLFSGGGLLIYAQNNSNSPTYAGTFPNLTSTFTPRSFYGSITFSPTSACTDPPTAGNAIASAAQTCSGQSITLDLEGNSVGTGQTYQWQSSTDNVNWTNIGPSSSFPIFTTTLSVTTYYRAAVTCGATTVNSASVQVTSLGSSLSGTFTINNGLPSGGGNFQSFTDAINALSCGIGGPVVFEVAVGSGPYNEQVIIPQIAGASSSNTITFKGNLATLSFNSTTSADRAGILLDGADHIIIDSLIIDGSAGTYGWGVRFANQADSNTISNCVINMSTTNTTSSAHGPIVFSASTTSTTSTGNNGNYNIITGNTLNGGYYGITLYNSSTDLGMNNEFSNNKVFDTYSYAIYTFYQSGAIISGNEVSRPGRSSSTTTAGVYVSTGDINCLIEKNRIHNMFDAISSSSSTCYGIYVSGDGTAGQENKIINNLIYNIAGSGTHTGTQYGIYNTTGEYMQVYHNTISLDDVTSTSGSTYGLYQTGTADGIDYRNNVVVISRSGTGTKRCIDLESTASTIISNNNVLYMNAASGTSNLVGEYGTSTYTTLTDWQTANSNAFDQQSISLDPLFVNPAGGDFTPTEASINNIGQDLGIATDILGTARGSSPDPGAFEFTLPGCANPPVPGIATSTVIDVCPNMTFTLNLDGNSVGAGQTYQWQSSPTNAAPWTNVGSAETSPIFSTSQTVSLYYRCEVVCSGGTAVYSTSVLVTSPSLISGTFTINSGLPTGSGNFQTFQEAVDYLACGIDGPVVFNVALGSGPYNEQVVIPAIPGTSSSNTVTFNGNLATLTFNSTVSAERAGIVLDGADHIVIDSLIIDGSTGTYGWGIHFINQADSNTVSNCIINVSDNSTSSTAFAPIVFSNSGTSLTTSGNNGNYNTITGNTLQGGYYGISLYNSSTDLGMENVISNNKIQNSYTYGVYMLYQSGALISGNDISKPTRADVSTGYGVYVNTGNINCLIEKNRVHNMFDGEPASTSAAAGVYVSGDGTAGQENKVINNLIYSLGGNGTQYGIANSTGEYMQAYHNTISLDDQSSTSGAATGLYQTGAAGGLDYRNNIVVITRAGTGTKRCIDFSTTGSTIISNNNVLYMNVTGGTSNHLGEYGTTTYTTLTDWQTANSNAFDQQSLSVDPGFTNPASADFTPTSSLVNNSGVALGVTTDIVDSVRDASTPDPGAYEFSTLVAGINMSAEVLLAPGVNPNGCYTTAETVTIRIRNNSTGTINFAVTPVTVTVEVTGAVTQTLMTTINTGTLAADGTLNVNMPSPLDMTTAGIYTFNGYTTVTGDVNPADDAMLPADIERVALDPGTVVASPGVFCVTPGIPTLSTSGETAVETYQWQQSIASGTGFTDIVGATSSSYTPASAITQDMYYRLVVGCGGTTITSPEVSVIISNPQILTTTPDSRCGPGDITLTATSSPGTDIKWYADPTGGTELATGPGFTTTVTGTTDFYVEASQAGGGGAAPVIITEINIGDPDGLEIQNVSGAAVDVTNWKVAISNSYTDITNVNTIVQSLSGTMTPGEIKTWSDASSSANYWGNNILWNPGSFPGFAGWAAILDNNDNLVDIVFLNWPAADIQSASVTVGTTTITVGSQWSGSGINISSVASTESLSRQGTSDNNDATDFSIVTSSLEATNPAMTLPFSGFGCTSPRVMVTATVTAAPAFVITQDSTVCNSSVTALTVESVLSDFDSYTWSPVTGLFTDATATTPYTGGSASTVYASLAAGGVYKYFATANNSLSSCSNIDSVELTVLPASITISATQEDICVSGTTTLSIPSGIYGTSTIQWHSSPDGTTYTPIAGATSTNYTTPTLTTTTYYKVEIVNGAGAACLQPVIIINVNSPQVTSVTDASRCGPGTLTLAATGSAGTTLNWYADAVGGAPVGTGTSFTTPSLTSTTTYYVAAASGGGSVTSAGFANAVSTSGYTLEAGLFFDALSDFTLDGVYVYPIGTGAGTATIALQDNSGATIQSVVANLTGTASPYVKTYVPLNFTVATGTDYRLVMLTRAGSVSGLIRESGSSWGSYPLTTPGILSITAGKCCPSGTSTSYYYFYDWQISTGCQSARTPVNAVITDNTSVLTDPVDMLVCPGDNVTFTVSAAGGNLTYQWRKDGADIAGATSADYTITGVSATDVASYDVIVNGDCGADTSMAAALTLNAPTAITVQPVAQSVCAGDDVTFSVTATGGGTLTYQWQKDGTDIPGATSADYTITGTGAANTGNYNVVVTGDCGTITSSVAALSLNAETTITTQPADQLVCEGDNVTLSVVASGTGTLTYQWQKGGADISGATSADYTITGIAAADAGNYSVVVTGDCGAVTSSVVTLTMNAATAITAQPVSQTICQGEDVTLSVTATGTNISYQWRVNGTDISGATSPDLTITGAVTANSGNYEVVITGDCGVVTSATAVLTVNPPGAWTGAISSDWNNPANWCGGSVPTSVTDVTIPSSAPNMPILNAAGEARNISLNTGSTLSVITGGVLDLYGSISGGGTFTAANGSVVFLGASNQSAPGFTAANVTMNGAGGFTLGGNTEVTGTLTLTMGSITLGANSLTLGSGSSGSAGSHIITNGTGMVVVSNLSASQTRTIPVGSSDANYNPVVLQANASHTADNLMVRVIEGVFENGVSGSVFTTHVANQMWIINEAVAGGSNVNITLQWNGSQELAQFDRSKCYVMQHDGTQWVQGAPSAATGSNPYTQTKINVTSFSPFAVQTQPIPTPVTGIYPNPTSDFLNVVTDLLSPGPVLFSVFDSKGQLVYQKQENLSAGLNLTRLELGRLASGIYLVKVSTRLDREFLVQRFIKTN